LVVGGGLAGIAAAVGLRKRGLDVLLVEKEVVPRDRFRGEYLQPFAVEALDELGFRSVIDALDARRVSELHFTDLKSDHTQVLSDLRVRYPRGSAARAMPNLTLNRELREVARRQLGERFLEGATAHFDNPGRLSDPEFTLTLQDGSKRQLRPQWVLGCDGRNSQVRKWMGGEPAHANGNVTFRAAPEFIVGAEFEARHGSGDVYEVIRTYGQGTLCLFQIGDNKLRLYWNTAASAPTNKSVWEGKLKALIDELPALHHLRGTNISRLMGTAADTQWLGPPARGRFLLLGDAVAITTPFGGQGMTCALRHVQHLVAAFDGCRLDSDLHAFLLRREYTRLVKKTFDHFSLVNFVVHFAFYRREIWAKPLAHHCIRTWNQHPELRDRAGRLFGGFDQDTPGVLELLNFSGLIEAARHPTSVLETLRTSFA